MQCATGTYAGDGIDDTWINAPGFQPVLVIIKGDLAEEAVWLTSTMPVNNSLQFADNAGVKTNRIQLFGANGFQIGNHAEVNQAATDYHWIAVRVAGATDFAVGTYTGDGADNRSIVVGFQPTVVILQREGASTAKWRVAENANDDCLEFDGSVNIANCIQDFEANGFQVGDDASVNANGDEYHWVAWKDTPGWIDSGTYEGDGNDDRDIAVGFQPDVVFVKGDLAEVGYLYTDSMGADDSAPFTFGALAANRIQALEANGFEVGTANEVNSNLADYFWLSLKAGTSVAPVVPPKMMYQARQRRG